MNTKRRPYTERLLERAKFIAAEQKLINRYLFYCILQVETDIRLSWIKKWEDKELKESIYLQLLKIWSENLPYNSESDKFKPEVPTKPEKYLRKAAFDLDVLSSLPEEVAIEMAMCPRRFFYSYVVDDSPSFNSDFHHQFVFTGLTKAVSAAAGTRPGHAAEELKSLFPHWSSLQKKQLLEYIGGNEQADYEEYQGIYYIKQRKYPHFLNKIQNNELLMKKIEDGSILDGTDEFLFKAEPEKGKCMYCPHIDYCKDSIFPLDREEE